MTIDDGKTAAVALVQGWATNAHNIHKRPPYRAHNFGDDLYWVVGTTTVSVLHGWSGYHTAAQAIADALNAAAEEVASAPEGKVG